MIHGRVVAPAHSDCPSKTRSGAKTAPFAKTGDASDGGENIIVAAATSDVSSSSSSSASSSDPENILAVFAASAAAAEEAALAAAFAGTSTSTSSESGSDPAETPAAAAAETPAAAAAAAAAEAPSSSSSAATPAAPGGPNAALAAKIAAARAYKAAAAERAAKGDSNIGVAAKSGTVAAPPVTVARAPPAPAGPSFTRSTPPPPSKTAISDNVPVEKRGLFEGSGSETEAAAFLRGVFSSGEEEAEKEGEKRPLCDSEEMPLDPNMRAEEFTALKTARERARGAEIITVDAGANAAEGGGEGREESSEEGENGYRPRVATWGVFPRPDNISKAFGGGRTIKPGDALESPEEKEARLKRQRAALENYRKKVGLVVDPRDEIEATRLVSVGNELMRRGALQEAADEFTKAADLLPSRSAVGGRARLQKAICLDSLGKRDEAFALYKSVEGHPLDSIGKETKRMLFGFQAMEDLKAHTISYAPDKEAYAPFFGKLKSDWDTQYVASTEEKEEGSLSAVVAAVAVVATPLLLFGALTLGK